jgi:hypothetical protein
MIPGVCIDPVQEAGVPARLVVRFDAGLKPVGHRWVPVIAYNSNPADPFSAPDPQELAARAGEIARTSHDQVAAYEVTNEPNFERFWHHPDPAAFARVYLAARAAIRRYDSVHPVISGGVFDQPGWETFVRLFLRRVIPDLLGVHPYLHPVESTREAERLLPGRVAVTEYGVGRETMTEPVRAKWMRRTTRRLARLRPRFLIAYSWTDPSWQLRTLPTGRAFLDQTRER